MPLSQEFAAASRGVRECSAGNLAMAGAPRLRVNGKPSERIQLLALTGGCIVVLERRGPFLLANDNAGCGGHNVRFVGIYLRRAAR